MNEPDGPAPAEPHAAEQATAGSTAQREPTAPHGSEAAEPLDPRTLGRVLVTGANGQLGRRLIRRLRGAGVPAEGVRALVRSERAAETLRALPEDLRPEIVVADYADAGAVEGAARGCIRAVHLVGILKETATTRYATAHEGVTHTLARAAERAGLERVAYLSILGAHPRSPNPCLGSKGRAEQILLRGPVPAAVLRVPLVLGEGDPASRALARQARARLLPLVRGGASLEQPVYAGDVVDAVLAALVRPDAAGARLDLAGPECLSHRELVLRCTALLGAPPPRIVPVPLGAVRLAARAMARLLANPPLTPAMLEVIEHDDRIDPQPAAKRLGIDLTPLDETLGRAVIPEASR